MSLFRNLAVAAGLLVLPSVVMAQVNPPAMQQGARTIEKSTTAPTKPAVHKTRHVRKHASVKRVSHRTKHHVKRSSAPRPPAAPAPR